MQYKLKYGKLNFFYRMTKKRTCTNESNIHLRKILVNDTFLHDLSTKMLIS